MSIQTKSSKVCSNCIKMNKLPPCGVNTFRKGGFLIDILTGSDDESKTLDYLVCPTDAIKLERQLISFINSKCISCGLCINKCPFNNIELEESMVDIKIDFINSDIQQVSSFLRTTLAENYEIFTEVKAPGNARNKRLDIVIRNTEKFYIIKVLSTKTSLGKYERSYTEILKSIPNLETEMDVLFLYCDEKHIQAESFKVIEGKKIRLTHISIDNLITYFTG